MNPLLPTLLLLLTANASAESKVAQASDLTITLFSDGLCQSTPNVVAAVNYSQPMQVLPAVASYKLTRALACGEQLDFSSLNCETFILFGDCHNGFGKAVDDKSGPPGGCIPLDNTGSPPGESFSFLAVWLLGKWLTWGLAECFRLWMY